MTESHFMTKRNKQLMQEKKDVQALLDKTQAESKKLSLTVSDLSNGNQEKQASLAKLKAEI